MKRKKIQHRFKRKFAKVRTNQVDHNRAVCRVFRIYPDWSMQHVVEVRIATTRKRMYAERRRLDGVDPLPNDYMGMVRSYYSHVDSRPTVRPRMMIARMYLNIADLQSRPTEISTHECTHAGMAWARWRRANLNLMEGEEVLAYAVGILNKQLATVCYETGIWK